MPLSSRQTLSLPLIHFPWLTSCLWRLLGSTLNLKDRKHTVVGLSVRVPVYIEQDWGVQQQTKELESPLWLPAEIVRGHFWNKVHAARGFRAEDPQWEGVASDGTLFGKMNLKRCCQRVTPAWPLECRFAKGLWAFTGHCHFIGVQCLIQWSCFKILHPAESAGELELLKLWGPVLQ